MSISIKAEGKLDCQHYGESITVKLDAGKLTVEAESGSAAPNDHESCSVTLSALGTIQLYFFLHKALTETFTR